MRKLIVTLTAATLLFGTANSANAMGYLGWIPDGSQATTFSQKISIANGPAGTAWKAQVSIAKNIMFGIALNNRQGMSTVAEFGAYFDSGITSISTGINSCSPQAGASSQFMYCTIPVTISYPAAINLSVVRDSTDSSGQTWLGYFTDLSNNIPQLIGKFRVETPNLTITGVLEYTYPYSADECISQPVKSSAIYWQPISNSGKFILNTQTVGACSKVQFVNAADLAKSDGVQITLNSESTSPVTYGNSIYEYLYPEVWQLASVIATQQSQKTYQFALDQNKLNFDSQISTLNATITASQSQMVLLQNQLEDFRNQIVKLNKQIKDLNSKQQKVCSIKPKPKGC